MATTASNDLNISETGFQSFIPATGVFHGRTLTAGIGVSISNGDGTAGNPTISLTGGRVAIGSIQGDTGTVIAGTDVSIFASSGSATAGASVKFNGSSATELDLNTTDATFNTFIGKQSGATVTGSNNTALGYNSFFDGLGSNNVALGSNAIGGVANQNTSAANVAIGYFPLFHLTTGSNNIGIGTNALSTITTGSSNICLGNNAGNSYATSETGNIILGDVTGTVGESHIMRLGDPSITKAFVAGVLNTSAGRVVKITTPGAYPYTTLITDYVILVDSSSARTIVPLASPVTGTTYRIKDNVGSAATNTITITPSGKNIDGAASTTITTNYGSIDITYNGTEWSIL